MPTMARPASRTNDGTSTARTSVASGTTAGAGPTPGSFSRVTPEMAKTNSTAATRTAAGVMMRPVCRSPKATDSVLRESIGGRPA
ncbi:hypothetical protein AVL59_28890 [Streptomyces griseochromogenes]|uniref:Uncharacterized protein n=1 Tax=Streptomyces griseochromogenes TaxID=68214 RepID=A0A1B1B2H6_9ACTN|nr:hypothetical protein AVL59_28890 [Streptomyces griseochromogenes]